MSPLLTQFRGHDKYPVMGGYGVDFQNCELFVPLWHPRSKAASGETFKSFDKNGHTITNTGATWADRQGYTFDPVDDFISLPVAFDLQVFTIIACLKPNVANNNGMIFSNYAADGTHGYTFRLNSGTYYFASINAVGAIQRSVTSAATYVAGENMQLGMVNNGDSNLLQLYKNGVVDANTDTDSTILYSTSVPRLGRSSEGGLSMNGILAEIFFFYNVAFTGAQMKQHYLSAKRRMPWANLP